MTNIEWALSIARSRKGRINQLLYSEIRQDYSDNAYEATSLFERDRADRKCRLLKNLQEHRRIQDKLSSRYYNFQER